MIRMIYVLTTGICNKQFLEEYIDSIHKQTYDKFYTIIIIDNSDEELYAYIKKNEALFESDNILIICNRYIKTAVVNQTEQFYKHLGNVLNDEDIICVVDMDDTLRPDAIETINKIYSENPEVWLTYGSFSPSEFDPSSEIDWSIPIREQWKYSALRTYKWFLYKNIKKEDFGVYRDNEWQWIPFCVDRLIMYPLLEMAGKEHVYYNKKIIYDYRLHDNNEFCMAPQSNGLVPMIKKKQPYKLKTKEELCNWECDWDD